MALKYFPPFINLRKKKKPEPLAVITLMAKSFRLSSTNENLIKTISQEPSPNFIYKITIETIKEDK